MFIIKDENKKTITLDGTGIPKTFKLQSDAEQYCRISTSMYAGMILSIFDNQYPVAHFKNGKLLYSVR